MNNQKQNDTSLEERKSKLMAERRRYYVENGREGEFASLPGHVQRAVEREANFQLDSMIKSDTYIEALDNDNAKELFQAHCEYYAHVGIEQDKVNPYNPNNLLKRLVERDSDANKNRDFLNGENSYKSKSDRHAKTIDSDTNKENAQGHIMEMLQKKQIRTI